LVILGNGLGIEPADGIGAHDQPKCGRAFLGQGHERDRGCDQTDALLSGRVTYETMEAAWGVGDALRAEKVAVGLADWRVTQVMWRIMLVTCMG
jgi:hypothetical protein